MEYKVKLINCYFGKLPNYFPLWLRSCACNREIDFLFVTDAEVSCPIPPNVEIKKTCWEDLLHRFQAAFPFPIAIESPYKLTDFKPAYGYLFEPELRGWDYWGYCDVDLVFGNLSRFLEEPFRMEAEKIFEYGHLTLYRNTPEMRTLFQKGHGAFSYREVFSRPEFYSFDEHAGMMRISRGNHVRIYLTSPEADISCRVKRFTLARKTNYPYQVFYWEDGEVYGAYLEDGVVHVRTFSYIHFQKRKFSDPEKDLSAYYLLSDRFERKQPGVPTAEEIIRLSEFQDEETDGRQLASHRMQKMKAFMRCPLREKRIWIKQKLSEAKLK